MTVVPETWATGGNDRCSRPLSYLGTSSPGRDSNPGHPLPMRSNRVVYAPGTTVKLVAGDDE